MLFQQASPGLEAQAACNYLKSSQYSTLSPTKPDKIENLRVEVQAITLAGSDGVSYTPCILFVFSV